MSIERVERKHRGAGYRVWLRGSSGRTNSRTFDSLREARAFEGNVRISKERGTLSLVDGGTERLADLVVEWWQAYAGPQLAPRTQAVYAAILDNHILPRLGDLRLRELRPALIDDLRSSGVGEETIRKSLAILQTCLQRAELHDRIASNPVAAVRKPSQARRRVIEPLAPARVEAMRGHLLLEGRTSDATLVSILAYAGLRPGEALALTWGDVRDRTIMVSKRAILGKVIDGAKSSRRSVRAVTMPAALRSDLLEWQLLRGRPAPITLVFPSASGGVWIEHDYRNWRRRIFSPAATAAGVEGIRPYNLRHSFASLLLAQGRSVIDVADQLGHAPTLTLDTYGHDMHELERLQRSPDEVIAAARRTRTAGSGRPTHPTPREGAPETPLKDPVRKGPSESRQSNISQNEILALLPASASHEIPASPPKPSNGLEPLTPSLPWRQMGLRLSSRVREAPADSAYLVVARVRRLTSILEIVSVICQSIRPSRSAMVGRSMRFRSFRSSNRMPRGVWRRLAGTWSVIAFCRSVW